MLYNIFGVEMDEESMSKRRYPLTKYGVVTRDNIKTHKSLSRVLASEKSLINVAKIHVQGGIRSKQAQKVDCD